jgi:hypothetical protein
MPSLTQGIQIASNLTGVAALFIHAFFELVYFFDHHYWDHHTVFVKGNSDWGL